MRTALVVDGNSIAWRAYHATGAMSARGVPTGMAYQFLRMLRNALDAVGATAATVAWDGGHPAFRTALLPGYKAKRGPRTPEVEERLAAFAAQQALLGRALPLLGVGVTRAAGWEADDVVAYLARQALLRLTARVVVYSGDRDMWQLLERGSRVSVLYPSSREAAELLTPETLLARTGGLSAAGWRCYRALTGDASDGIPGVGGVGEKRGRELVFKGLACLPDEKREAYERNERLMNLWESAARLGTDLAAGRAVLSGLDARRDLPAARQALNALQMHSLTAAWGEWSRPFHGLKGNG